MFQVNVNHHPEYSHLMRPARVLPPPTKIQSNPEIDKMLAELSPEIPWGDRQKAAKRLGAMRRPEALPGLLEALPDDPFWMVRCSIIQALELIGDPGAIPTLRQVAQNDGFLTVRSYAATAIERLS